MATATAEHDPVVRLHHQVLYRFAFCLSRSAADAENLTQAAFRLWATRRDSSGGEPENIQTWLLTALHRHFAETRHSHARFPHFVLADLDAGLPPEASTPARSGLDAAAVLRVLSTLDEIFQAPLALFYLADSSYEEIAEILGSPVSAVRSRIARGKAQLHERLSVGGTPTTLAPHTRTGAVP